MTASPAVTFSSGRSSHFAYFEDDGTLVVEWYDFGEHAPYESANLLRHQTAYHCIDCWSPAALMSRMRRPSPRAPLSLNSIVA